MDRTFLCTEAQRALSVQRLSAYKLPGETDTLNGISRSLWNTALCEALYPTIQCFEIVLRNVMHDSLSKYYRPDWIIDESKFRDKEWNQVLDAQDSLEDQRKWREGDPWETSRIVAELHLGFWTGLFNSYYDRIFAIPLMNDGLRGFPSPIRNRHSLNRKFDDVRFLRNRVFHHEPIWHWDDLPLRHQRIVEYIGYINPTQQKLNHLLDRFESVHASGWKSYRAKIGEALLPKTEPTSPEVVQP